MYACLANENTLSSLLIIVDTIDTYIYIYIDTYQRRINALAPGRFVHAVRYVVYV